MLTEFTKHSLAYLVLALALIIFVIVFLAVWPNHLIQRVVILALAIFYFLWGFLLHLKNKEINQKIMSEYAAVSLLAALLLFLITL